jgi:hypothetical protein
MALPIAGGVPSEVVALGQELQGVAADIYGNVYLASPGADQVLELAGGRLPQDQIGSGLAIPRGVAVDLLGNVFVLGSVPAYQVIKGLGERSPGPDGVPGVTEIQTRCATFPAAQVGGPGTRLTLTFGFKGSGALGGAQVQGPCFVDTGEGTLAQNGPAYDYGYPNSDTATVVVEFDPLRPGAPSGGPGTQLGGLDLMGSDGTIQASVLLDGTGLAPRASFLPATPTAINLGSFGVTPQPMGVAADSLGNVYVADAALGKVVKITPGSHTQPEVVLDGLTSPQGIAVDGDFKVYCADPGSRRVLMGAYRPGNTYLQIIVDSAAENPGLGVPVDVKVDLAGNILVADRSGAQVMTGLRPGDLPQDRQLHQSGVRPGDLPVLPVLHVAVLLGPDPGQLPGVQQAFRPGSAGRPVA